MSAWSTQRQTVLFLSFLAILICILGVTIFIFGYNRPTCFDGILNQAEEDVDCGGECNACILPPKNLIDVWVRPFKLEDGLYAAVAYIENPNMDRYVPEVQYNIEFYDGEGIFVTNSSNIVSIRENGATAIFIPHVLSGERDIIEATFKFVGEPNFKQTAQENTAFKTIQTNIVEYKNEPEVTATLMYIGDIFLREVELIGIVYDQQGTAIAASKTLIENVTPGDTRNVTFTWVNPFELLKAPCFGTECIQLPERVEIIPVVKKK